VFGGWNCELKQNNHHNFGNFIDKIEKIKINKTYIENQKKSKMELKESTIKNENLFDGKWEFVNLEIMNESLIFNEILRKSSIGVITLNESKLLLIGGDSSEFIEESYINNFSPGIGVSNKNNDSLILEVKIKNYGDWEIVVKEAFLKKEACFMVNKQFIKIDKGDNFIYGTLDDSNQKFCKIEIDEEGNIQDHFYNL